MNQEQLLINQWRLLSPEKQQEVIQYILSLASNEQLQNKNIDQADFSLQGKVISYQDT